MSWQLTGFLKPRKDPKKVRGREIPNQRQRRARRVVKGMAADDPAPQRSKFRKKKTPNTTLKGGKKKTEEKEVTTN